MSKRDMGGPAFPAPYEFITQQDMGSIFCSEGMTLWDYYAAHCPSTKIDLAMKNGGSVSCACAAHADAMLRERAKREGDTG